MSTARSPLVVAVMGASGFVGSAVTAALGGKGVEVRTISAPRVRGAATMPAEEIALAFPEEFRRLREKLAGVLVVVNCAGQPDASSRDEEELAGANALAPALLAQSAREAGVRRLVHVSSAVVQGRRDCLDETNEFDLFSSYAASKARGEELVAELGPRNTVSYRPPSVHAPSRRVTRMTARIARSPFTTVASPGSQNSPQAHIDNVADLIAFLALTDQNPPAVVMHPSEGITSASLMRLLSGREPRRIPCPLAQVVVSGLAIAGRLVPAVAANARRIEMLWFGQKQAVSWASEAGWAPVAGKEQWHQMGELLNNGGVEK